MKMFPLAVITVSKIFDILLPKTDGRLKLFLPSFLERVATGEPHFWLFRSEFFIPFQWDLNLLIALTKTSVEGGAVPFFF